MGAAAAPSAEALSDIPGNYLELYQQAAVEYKLGGDGWSVLAGVGKIETDHGRLDAPGCDARARTPPAPAARCSSCSRPGTRTASTATATARKDRYDPRDAIPGAANYLKASGAPGDWRRALFAYNHAGWYVDDVARAGRGLPRAAAAEPQAVAQPSAGGGGRPRRGRLARRRHAGAARTRLALGGHDARRRSGARAARA